MQLQKRSEIKGALCSLYKVAQSYDKKEGFPFWDSTFRC